MTITDRMNDMLERYGEVCPQIRAARILSVSPRTIARMADDGRLRRVGAHIDVRSATRIGLFPPELLPRTRAVGNSAGEGASAVLLSQEACAELDHVMEICEYIELSTSAAFNEHYVDQMTFDEE